MARNFAGVSDDIDFGSDASVDDFSSKTIAAWLRCDLNGAGYQVWCSKALGGPSGIWQCAYSGFTSPQSIQFYHMWSTTDGEWTADLAANAGIKHIVITYDRSNAANNALVYIDGVAATTSETQTPSGSASSDAAFPLVAGDLDGGPKNPFDGLIGNLCVDNTIWDAATVNRHRWWGCAPGGPSTVKVWHPFWTTALVNKGTATATGTATGTSVDNASVPRVERMYAGMMGVGR